jgi:hypothetical protein
VTQTDFQFGLQPPTVRRVLSFVIQIFFLAEKRPTKEDFAELFDGTSKDGSTATSERKRFQFEITDLNASRHAEIALLCLTLESLAFLTDEQQSELREANFKRMQSWRTLLDVCFSEVKIVSADEFIIRRADAVFLTQMEWMRDVGFDSCPHGERLRILAESPIAHELSGI